MEGSGPKQEEKFSRKVGKKEDRKLRARKKGGRSIWLGFGMFGLIGWSIAIPVLLGAALGAWLDERYPGPHSWTLACLIAGFVLGCLNAWYWVDKETREIDKDLEEQEE